MLRRVAGLQTFVAVRVAAGHASSSPAGVLVIASKRAAAFMEPWCALHLLPPLSCRSLHMPTHEISCTTRHLHTCVRVRVHTHTHVIAPPAHALCFVMPLSPYYSSMLPHISTSTTLSQHSHNTLTTPAAWQLTCVLTWVSTGGVNCSAWLHLG